MQKTVDTFIVGAAKSGTTSLVEYLKKSSQVFIPETKEPFYFVEDRMVGICSSKEYFGLYKRAHPSQQLVDASTGYLFDQYSPISIKQHNPNARIVIILRNPVHMCYSLWNYMRTNGVEHRGLTEAVLAESPPSSYKHQNWKFNYHYSDRAKYSNQVARYIGAFEHVKILIFEELISNPKAELEALCRFLGINPVEPFGFPKSNEGGTPKSEAISNLRNRRYPILRKIVPAELRAKLRQITRDINTRKSEKPNMSTDEALFLTSLLRDDVVILEEMLDRPLLDIWRLT